MQRDDSTEEQRPTVLIVDDRNENLIAMSALLDDIGATIRQATSGNDALATLLNEDIALVLLDVQMPGMDGFEVAELMRGNARTREIPIIFVTAISQDQKHVFKGYESGGVDYLYKPVDPFILRSKVDVFLQLWRQRHWLERVLAEKDELAERLRRQAELDPLTGLPNRSLFQDRLHQAILLAERHRRSGAVLFVDLDHFKQVNDTLGHEGGDMLLVQVAERLSSCLRKADTVARLGGDEFTVILHDADGRADADAVARKILTELATPFRLNGSETLIGGSIGISLFPDDSQDSGDLVRYADAAMYRAKDAGRNTYQFHAPR